MPNTTEALTRGWNHVQRGEWRQAEQILRQVIQAEPQHADALYLLGVCTFQQGNAEESLYQLRLAARLNPHAGFIHYHLGLVNRTLGKEQESIASYREAVRLQPDLAEAHNNLGVTLQNLGKTEEALACFQQAVRARPDYAEAHNNLGATYQIQGRLIEAIACYTKAVQVNPSYIEAINNRDALLNYQRSSGLSSTAELAESCCNAGTVLQEQGLLGEAIICYKDALAARPDYADAHNNMGAALHRLGKSDEALACFRNAIRYRPNYAEAHHNLGIALQAQNKLDEAIVSYGQAIRCRADFADAHNHLGAALHRQGKVEEALAAFEQAVRSQPDFAEAHNNLGFILEEQGRRPEALAHFEKALAIQPDYPEAHRARGLELLLAGNFEEGWNEYEWRFRCQGFPTPTVPGPKPAWDGSPLNGRTILLRAEQGLGDALQFIRYAPLVKERGGKVIVECHPQLIPLIRTCPGIDRVLDAGEPLPNFDVHAMLMSVPRLLGTKLSTIPANVPYLAADPTLVAHWRKELAKYPGFKIGIVWQGSKLHLQDRLRSVPLSQFAPLGKLPGVQLLSLQVGAGREQLTALSGFSVVDLAPPSFDHLAAVIKNLNLIIAVDTAPAHLAGALAAPVWVALSFVGEWRWLQNREDSPWYPSMRLFRQKHLGKWDEVFTRMAGEVRRLL